MIQPGLTHISNLLSRSPLPWRAVHVAGTNGKGSICNYVASMFGIYNEQGFSRLTGHPPLKWGKFTSPHLIDRWDGVSINNHTISRDVFNSAEGRVLERNETHKFEASEFEVLTATAFELFTDAKVDVGVVEVGMGGRLDATNLLGVRPEPGVPEGFDPETFRAKPLVTAISKIGLDHQAFLGDTVQKIASEKAGIMKPGVPVVYDHSNLPEVKAVLRASASKAGVKATGFEDLSDLMSLFNDWSNLPPEELPLSSYLESSGHPSTHREQNLSVALRATWLAFSQLNRLERTDAVGENAFHQALVRMAEAMKLVSLPENTPNPGRHERLQSYMLLEDVRHQAPNGREVLLDGAHNSQSAEALSQKVSMLREANQDQGKSAKVTWVLAASEGRNIDELLVPLLRPGDSVFAVEFGPVEGMPWVKPVAAEQVLSAVARIIGDDHGPLVNCGKDVPFACAAAISHGHDRWTVIAGSLYLVGDVHRFSRNKTDADTRRLQERLDRYEKAPP